MARGREGGSGVSVDRDLPVHQPQHTLAGRPAHTLAGRPQLLTRTRGRRGIPAHAGNHTPRNNNNNNNNMMMMMMMKIIHNNNVTRICGHQVRLRELYPVADHTHTHTHTRTHTHTHTRAPRATLSAV